MIIFPQYNGLYTRYSMSQAFLEPASAILLGSAIMGGSSMAGGLLGGKKSSVKKMSTFSKDQKSVNRVLADFLLGITRDAKGNEISRNPLLTRAFNKQMPMMKVAPLTGNQQAGLKAAQALLGKITNAPRPDQNYLSNLARGILPGDQNPRYAALGASLRPGERAVVGEDGAEIIEVNKDGTVTVIPNPHSVSSPANMAEALGKSEKAKKKLGAEKGFVAGGTLETKRKYGNYYLPYNASLEGGNYWDPNNTWTSDVKSAFDTYLGDKYKDQKNTWYDTYQKEAGGDISKVGWTSPASGKEWINTNNPHWQKDVQLGYRQDLQDWWNSLESATGNAEVQKALSGVTDYNDFNTWWEGSKYADPKNSIVMRGGQIDFNDPYSVDMGNLNTALADYQKYYTTEGPGSQAAQTAAAAPYDYSGILSQLKPDQYEAFNKYVKTYQNGGLGDAGIKYNPQTGQSEMYAANGYQMGMRNAVRDFMAGEKKTANALAGLNGTTGVTFTGEDLVPDASGNLVPDPAKYEQVNGTWQEKTSMANSLSGDADIDNTISLLNEALAAYFKPFDTTKADETFTKSVYDPTMRTFEEKTRPSIRESFAGGDLFSSARQQAEDTAKMDLEKQLASDRSTYVANQEENYKNRALSAMGVGLSLAQLPTTLAGAKADVEYKKAAAASLFADIETQNALVNSQLNNDELLAITTLMSLFGTEQQQQQAEWNAAFQNALNADNLDFATILQLVMGYQDQSQVAVVS